jgi:hypothetical protein
MKTGIFSFASLAACGAAAAAACSSGMTDPARPSDSGVDGSEAGADAIADVVNEPGAATSEAEVGDARDTAAPVEAAPPQALLRVANWSPDAPAGGYDICLAPVGTANWSGPLLHQSFPSGIGAAAATGVTFPVVSAYVPVAPGTYDLQLVSAASPDCSTGVIQTTQGLPSLVDGSHTTFAVIGDVVPTNRDARQKVTGFFDDSTAPHGLVGLRAVNTVPSRGAIDVTVVGAAGEPMATFVDVPFGGPGATLADGGSADPNGYAPVSAAGNVQFVAQAPGGTPTVTTASGGAFSAGDVVTLAVVGGENGGAPPSFLMCTDNGAPANGTTPCRAFP